MNSGSIRVLDRVLVEEYARVHRNEGQTLEAFSHLKRRTTRFLPHTDQFHYVSLQHVDFPREYVSEFLRSLFSRYRREYMIGVKYAQKRLDLERNWKSYSNIRTTMPCYQCSPSTTQELTLYDQRVELAALGSKYHSEDISFNDLYSITNASHFQPAATRHSSFAFHHPGRSERGEQEKECGSTR